MGAGITKMRSRFKKNEVVPLQVKPTREVTEIKHEVEEQMQEYRHVFDPQIGKNGVSFYTSVDDVDPKTKKDKANKPKLSSESRGDCLSDAFTAKERHLMADVIFEEHLRQRTRVAKVSEERRQLLLRRREQNKEDMRQKYEEKMKRSEALRKEELRKRLRQTQAARPTLSYHGQPQRSMFELQTPVEDQFLRRYQYYRDRSPLVSVDEVESHK